MREEIEAAALFITRLVNKNLQQSSNACTSTASSIHSHSSSLSSSASTSSSSSFTSSDSPPDLDDQQQSLQSNQHQASPTTNSNNGSELDKVEQFRQCLTEALYERFLNHWFPEQPSKGQAYRCIRLNEWDRRDITLQKACSQCGIDYKELQLPVELTLWVDPDEVTCRFGENKGSHCLVAKFKDGELKDNNIDIDINNIDIEIFGQMNPNERMRQNQHHHQNNHQQHHHQHQQHQAMHGSPQHHNNRLNNSNGNINSTYQYLHNSNSSGANHHQQTHHQQHQPSSPQQPPHHHHHHRATNHLGKATPAPIITSPYHGGYTNGCDTNGNPIPYYYF